MTVLPVLALLVLTQAEAPTESSSDEGDSILLAPKAGFFKSTTPLKVAPYYALEAGYLTPLLNRRLAIVMEGSLHRSQVSGTLSDPLVTRGDVQYTLTEREIAILLSAMYRFEGALDSITPYVGAGPGLYLHQATTQALGATTVEKKGIVGFQLLGGAELPLWSGSLFLEAHYHFAPVDLVTTGEVNIGGFLAAVGYRLRL
jgi:hypothetical protein